MAEASTCRRCSECRGQEHHFMGIGEHDQETDEIYYPCKHCDARMPVCDECMEPFWPVLDDSGLCAACRYDQDADNGG